MPIKLSYDVCKEKLDYLNKEVASANWVLKREKNNDTVTYYLYWNGKLKTTGTLKEIDNYIEGLYMGYGVYRKGTSNQKETKNAPLTATLDFTVKKEPLNKELLNQVEFYSVQDYHCVVQYSPKPDDNFYMTITIDRYCLDKSKRSTVLKLPKIWLDVRGLDYFDTVKEKAKNILEIIDQYIAEYAIQAIENEGNEKGLNYLSTLTEMQSMYYDYVIENLLNIYGKKIEGLYTSKIEITNIKSKNLAQITYKDN